MKNRNIKLKTYDDIFNVIESLPENDIKYIDTDMLTDFRDHPFKINENKDMEDLLESILANGVLVPILVRPLGDRYEIISGHRRRFCAAKAGLKQVPCVVKDMSYDEAVLVMVDSNIQRKNILPSEKAFSYKMKLNAIKRQGERTDLTSRQVDAKSEEETTSRQVDAKSEDETTSRQVDDMSENAVTSRQVGDKSAKLVGKDYSSSERTVQRYIRLTELTPFFISAVDTKKFSLGAAIDLSYLEKDEQNMIENVVKELNRYPSMEQTKLLRNLNPPFTEAEIMNILTGNNDSDKKVEENETITIELKKIRKYFPENYTAEDIEKTIMDLMKKINL
jgi:ParB family chromosome partitioning protein